MKLKQAKVIAKCILDDLHSRRGLRQAWDEIDEVIQDEILEGWVHIIKRGADVSETQTDQQESS